MFYYWQPTHMALYNNNLKKTVSSSFVGSSSLLSLQSIVVLIFIFIIIVIIVIVASSIFLRVFRLYLFRFFLILVKCQKENMYFIFLLLLYLFIIGHQRFNVVFCISFTSSSYFLGVENNKPCRDYIYILHFYIQTISTRVRSLLDCFIEVETLIFFTL